MIRVAGLVKRYGKTEALAGLDMEVPRGAVYGLIGHNGAGKTTTMRILAALLLPDGGTALVGGRDVLRSPEGVRRVIGYMPDFFGVYDDLRVSEYLEFYAGTYGICGPEAARLRDDLLELVDLADRREAYVDTLSRGMQQRLCLARALVHDPEVLLLDEPASGLDPMARVEMKGLLKELRRMGKTILISSHILSELADFCTHVGVMADGRMQVQGPLENILKESWERFIRIRVMDKVDGAVTVLEENPRVREVTARDGRLEVRFDGDAGDVARLLAGLVESGVPVLEFSETTRTLEDAFLRLAGGG